VTNTSSTIHADAASKVTLYGVTISRGVLTTTSSTGLLEALCCLGYRTLDRVTINGDLQWDRNNIGYLHGRSRTTAR